MSNVTLSHEAPLEVLRQTPRAVLELLRAAGLDPSSDLGVEPLDTELAEARPSVRRADYVALLRAPGGAPESLVIVEVQRDHDDDKPRAWLEYIAFLHRRHRVPTTLIVLTFERDVARWARKPRRVGVGVTFRPLVIGPDDHLAIVSIEDAITHRERAMLAALAHLGGRDATASRARDDEIVRVFEAMIRDEDARRRHVYLSLLHGLAGTELRSRLEELMEAYGMGALEMIRAEGKLEGKAEGKLEGRAEGKLEGKAEGKLEGKAEGKLEGKAEALLAVLRAKGLTLDARGEALVRATTDLARVDRWLARAAVATSTAEVFDPDER